MTEVQPLSSNTCNAAKARYRCWETILTEEGDTALRAIDADLIMTAAVLGFSYRLLARGYPVEFFSDATQPKKITKSKSAVDKINWVLNRKKGKVKGTDLTESDTMKWKHGSVITGARGKKGAPFQDRHKTPRDFPENSAAREFFDILSHPKEGMIWGYQGRGAYTGYVVDSKGGSMTSSYRSNAPTDKTRWVPKEFCEAEKTWGLITGKEILKPEEGTEVWVRDVNGTLKKVDLGYGHGGMKQQDTLKLSKSTKDKLSNKQCRTGVGSGPSVLPDDELGTSRLVGYTHGMIQAIYMCEERQLSLKLEVDMWNDLKIFVEKQPDLGKLDDLADEYRAAKKKLYLMKSGKEQLKLFKLFDAKWLLKMGNQLGRLDALQIYAASKKEGRSALLGKKLPYDGQPFEIAVGAHTRKLASCFPCTLFMYGADYPPSAIHLGKGESWLPFYPSKDSKRLIDSAISNTNKKWHGECRANLASGLHILKDKRKCLESEHANRLGALAKYLNEHTSGEQAANLILDAITVHESEDARINRTIKDPPK